MPDSAHEGTGGKRWSSGSPIGGKYLYPIAIGLMICASVWCVGVRLWDGGPGYTWKDQRLYLGSAISLLRGDGLGVWELTDGDWSVGWDPLTHYPPLTSWMYFLGLLTLGSAGLPLACSVLHLLAWVVFLGGFALLVQRIGRSAQVTAAAVAIGAFAAPWLTELTQLRSEVFFMPLLVWSVLALGWALEGRVHRLVLPSVLLALMLLSRYVGALFLPAFLIWWWLVSARRRLPLRGRFLGACFLSAAALPLIAFLARNYWSTGDVVGKVHLQASTYSFWDGVVFFARQLLWIPLPWFRPGPIARLHPAWFAVVFGVAVIVTMALIWRAKAEPITTRRLWGPELCLVDLLVLFYIGVYVLLQPFLSFYPFSTRVTGPFLILVFVRLFGSLGACGSQKVRAVGAVMLGANLALAPAVVSDLGTLLFDDDSYSPKTLSKLERGVPPWLAGQGFRVGDLERREPALSGLLAKAGCGTALVTNEPDLFVKWAILPGEEAVERWLSDGPCSMPGGRVLLVVFPQRMLWWDTREDPGRLPALVKAKCPNLVGRPFDDALVYELGAGSRR